MIESDHYHIVAPNSSAAKHTTTSDAVRLTQRDRGEKSESSDKVDSGKGLPMTDAMDLTCNGIATSKTSEIEINGKNSNASCNSNVNINDKSDKFDTKDRKYDNDKEERGINIKNKYNTNTVQRSSTKRRRIEALGNENACGGSDSKKKK